MRTGIVVVAALIAVTSCSAEAPVTAPSVPVFTTSNPPSSQPADRTVPRTCPGLASLQEVTDILGVAVTGQTLPVIGVPEPAIGRTARIDCYYGVPVGHLVTDAAVWIGLASYTDDVAATRRMRSTVDAEREAGAKISDVEVGAGRGVLSQGARRMLVAARGKNTVVVTVVVDLVGAEQAGALLGRLADRALTPR